MKSDIRKVFLTFCFCFWSSHSAAQSLTADGGFTATPLRECQTDLRYLNQVSGWQTDWPNQWAAVAASRGETIEKDLDRWKSTSLAISQTITILRQSIQSGGMAPRPVVDRVWQQADDLALALKTDNSAYLMDAGAGAPATRWNNLVHETLAPAVESFADFLALEYMPAAHHETGLSTASDGDKCFRHAVKWWTTLDLSTKEIEAIGRHWMEDTRKALLRTATKGESIDEIMNRLREFSLGNTTSSDDIVNISREALERAKHSMHEISRHVPDVPLEIELLPAHLQPSFPAGFFRPQSDGQTAAYVINPSRPNERRLMAEVIALHEGLPGHYLFFSYPTKKTAGTFNSGLVEGWALYAEYVADEMELYSATIDRQGMITKHLWSASRLIVEPGLHIHGWTRKEAVEYMIKNTVMSRTEIEIEVDRYLALPGQSLGYMLGADLFLSERANAQYRLREWFDIRDYHHVILAGGMRPLPQIRKDIHTWVDNVASKSDRSVPPSALP